MSRLISLVLFVVETSISESKLSDFLTLVTDCCLEILSSYSITQSSKLLLSSDWPSYSLLKIIMGLMDSIFTISTPL